MSILQRLFKGKKGDAALILPFNWPQEQFALSNSVVYPFILEAIILKTYLELRLKLP